MRTDFKNKVDQIFYSSWGKDIQIDFLCTVTVDLIKI